MSTFIAILGVGKGTWAEVHGILALGNFEKIILFIDEWAVAEYRNEHNAQLTVIPTNASSEQLTALMETTLKEQAHGEFEVAVNISSGTGREHSALISAILKSGMGMRLVSFENGEFRIL